VKGAVLVGDHRAVVDLADTTSADRHAVGPGAEQLLAGHDPSQIGPEFVEKSTFTDGGVGASGMQ
jgi:hypothetical protein